MAASDPAETPADPRGPALAAPPGLAPAPVSPVDPAELVAEAVELAARAAVALALLPCRLTRAALRRAVQVPRRGR